MTAIHPINAIEGVLDDGFEDDLARADLSEDDEQSLRELSMFYKPGQAYRNIIKQAREFLENRLIFGRNLLQSVYGVFH